LQAWSTQAIRIMVLLSGSSIGSTSSSLIRRVRQHQPDAWRQLVRLYGPLVSFWIARTGLRDSDAEDVFQEVFTTVARGIAGFRKDRPTDTFRGWLRTIVRSRTIDFFRRAARNPQATGGSDHHGQLLRIEDPDWAESDEPGEADQIRALRLRALELIRADFEPKTWDMFWRVTVDGEATAEVATDLGVSPSAVRLAKSRVLRRLREELGDIEPEALANDRDL